MEFAEDLTFDIGDIISEDEAEKLFEEQEPGTSTEETEEENQEQNDNVEQNAEEEEEETQPSERVGEEDNEPEEGTARRDSGGSSPNVFSSIAEAFKKDGIFPDFDDEEIKATTTAEALAELVEKAMSTRIDERVKRADAALNAGVEPEVVSSMEKTIKYLESIKPEDLTAEGEDGDNLRKYLIYNNLLNKNFTKEKAMREIEKSFKANSEIEDAQDAYNELVKFYNDKYQEIQDKAVREKEEAKEKQKKQQTDFKKMILEDDLKIGETKLDKKTCQAVFDAVYTPSYKDPETGKLLTEVQRFQKEHPLEFLKQLGLWYVLTKSGKDYSGLTKKQVQAAKREGIRELERKINTSNLAPDGSLRFTTSTAEPTEDLLLSDDWQIG